MGIVTAVSVTQAQVDQKRRKTTTEMLVPAPRPPAR
jgi:hypothetical protein